MLVAGQWKGQNEKGSPLGLWHPVDRVESAVQGTDDTGGFYVEGKSTMMNALLGIALIPTDAHVSSKQLVTVHYTPRRKGSKLKLLEATGKVSTGLEGVRQRLHEVLESASNDDWHMEPALELNAAFCKTLGNDTESVVKLDLMEIPSISSVDPHVLLKDKLRTRLDDLDGAFFLIDFTKLRTENGEEEILKELKESFPMYTPQSGQRLCFCVTKADISIETEEPDHTEIQTYVSSLLREAGFSAQPSQIFVLSPLHALLSRLVIADKHDADLHMQFGQLVWGDVAELETDKSVWKAKATKLLELSGIPQFEEQVLGFFHRDCESLKLISLLDDSARNLKDVLDTAHSFKTMLSRTLKETRQGMERLKSQLENGTLYLTRTKTELPQIEKDVTIKVYERFSCELEGVFVQAQEILTKLKNVLLDRIGIALSTEVRDERPTSELPCGWRSIRQDFLAVIHHAAPDQRHAEELVKELHEEVVGQLRSEMEIAWMVVEDMIRDRHFELVLRTNQDLDQLSKLLEPVVIKDLNIQIEPAEIKIKQISDISFQRDLADLIASSIKEQAVERDYPYRWLWGSRYTVHLLDGDSIRDFFENIVRETTDEAIHQLQTSVHRHVAGQIASSEEKLRSFGDSFVKEIESDIEARMLSIDASSGSMQRVIEDIDVIKKLNNMAMALRRRIEMGLSTGQTSSEWQPQLEITCHRREESEAKSDQGRYIPPRSRVSSSEALTPRLNATDRSVSFPISELSDRAAESPKTMFNRPSDGDNWRISRSGSGTWGTSTGAQSPLRSSRPTTSPYPPRETPTSATHAATGDSFSPRSNFFRNFQQTPRATRGRGNEGGRTGSWAG